MIIQEDMIVEISKEREKYFGCSGKMLIPCPATVAKLLAEIPKRKLIMMDSLRRELARRAGVQVACPPSTLNALKAIATDPAFEIEYWRVVKKNGELLTLIPGGIVKQFAILTEEGFKLDSSGKTPKVAGFSDYLIKFD